MKNGMKRLVVGISGASCANLAMLLLKEMSKLEDWETHVVVSNGARRTLEYETCYTLKDVESLATELHPLENVGASIASGTFKTEGMVIVPCKIGRAHV